MPMTMNDAGKLGAEKSRPTREKQKQERIKDYFSNPYLCSNCQKPIDYEVYIIKKSALKSGKISNIFCGKSCSTIFNNKKRKNKVCECGNLILKSQKYCSSKCRKFYKWQELKVLIELGKISDESRPTLKKYTKERDGIKCSICEITDWCGKNVPLVLDHIDGNHENNFPSNLRLVCGNCNMQLPTFGSKNKGNGRFLRRQRRKEGKSC